MSVLSQQLSFRGRHRLAQILDQPNVRGCDWRSLVELMGFSYEMVMMLRSKESPTMALLEEWEMREGSKATLDSLIIMIEELENSPALDVVIQLREDFNKRSPKSPLKSPKSPSCSSLRSLSSSSSGPKSSLGGANDLSELSTSPFSPTIDPINLDGPVTVNGATDNIDAKQTQRQLETFAIDQQAAILQQNGASSIGGIREVLIEEEGEGGEDDDFMEQIRGRTLSELDRSLLKGHEFDVFLSFAPADMEFAIEMRLRLVHRANISVYIPSEGLMAGQSFQDEIADKIKRGCRKTIIILSPNYNNCAWCNYEARLAHYKNPDPRRHFLIPVMYRKCKVPDFIAYLFYLDYTRYKDNSRQCEEYFWERLYKSVRYQQR